MKIYGSVNVQKKYKYCGRNKIEQRTKKKQSIPKKIYTPKNKKTKECNFYYKKCRNKKLHFMLFCHPPTRAFW